MDVTKLPSQGAAAIRAPQILLAEVRASLDLQTLQMSGEGSAVLDTPPQAARALVELVIQSMPDEAGVPSWTAVLVRADLAAAR